MPSGGLHHVAVWAVLLFLLFLLGCGSGVPERLRITVIGVDGATWRVIDPLLARGELPNLERLIAAGVRAPLRSQFPLLSPAVWTTVATGVSRERHGIEKFQSPKGGLASSTERRVPALWTIVSAAGRRSAVINWWATSPAEPIDGVVVTEGVLKVQNRTLFKGGLAERIGSGLIHPPAVADLLEDLMQSTDLAEYEAGLSKVGLDKTPHLMRLEDGLVAQAVLEIRRQLGPFDLELFLMRGVDGVSHFFWQYYEPTAAVYPVEARPSPEDVQRYGRVIEDHYVYVDSLVGELTTPSAPDRVVLILSDHGFEAGVHGKTTQLFGTHATEAAMDGILIASGGPFRRGVRLEWASILDITPTVLHLFGLPVADDLEGRVLTKAFERSWSRSHPVQTLPSYATGVEDGTAATAAESPVDETLREELRALGYIE